MKTVKITDEGFTRFVWPAFASGSIGGVSQLDTILELSKKLKAVSEEQDEFMMVGQGPGGTVPARKLKNKTATLKLEEAEHKLLVKRMEALAELVKNAFVEEFWDVFSEVKEAPDYKEPKG